MRNQQRRGAVIFLHGSGDTGRGVREWLSSASGGRFEKALADLGLGPVVYPTAPEKRYSLAGGAPSTVWFDRERLDPGSRQDRAGVLRSLRQVEEEVRKLEDAGVPRGGVFVGGFSMGGCLALEMLGDQGLAGRLAGVFSHASFLNDESTAFEAARVSTPVYASHGGADGMVKVAWGRATAEKLKARGLDLSFKEHSEMDHELGEEQITGLLDWISAIVARPGFGQEAEAVAAEALEGGNGRQASKLGGGSAAAAPSEVIHAGQEPACSVKYEITEFGGCQSRASFDVPHGSEELLSGASICARGGFFQLEKVAATPGRVVTTFMSPKPELTAAAIARRIEQRLGDPRPPGMEEACCLS
eukprot:g1366.t1